MSKTLEPALSLSSADKTLRVMHASNPNPSGPVVRSFIEMVPLNVHSTAVAKLVMSWIIVGFENLHAMNAAK